MNRLAIVLCALAAVTAAVPVDQEPIPIPIVKQASDGPNPDGTYSYSFETGNGIQAQEQGHFTRQGTDEAALETIGSFAYVGDNGERYQITYVANENGFQPEGAHLPTAPPVPPLIRKALQYIAEHPEENETE